MTAASNSEARKRAAGIAASNPTGPEPTGTLEGAPGADSEALAASQRVEADALIDFIIAHTAGHLAPEFCTAVCLARAVLGSSWLADHDRQIAERVWMEGLRFGQLNWATNYAGVYGNGSSLRPAPNPYSEEARRG